MTTETKCRGCGSRQQRANKLGKEIGMSTKRTGGKCSAKADVRLANRAKGIRAQLRQRREELDSCTNKGMADLVKQLIVTVYKQRLKMARWSDLDRIEREALAASLVAASLVALDCGMTRAEFVQWLRDGADFFSTVAEWRNAPASSGTQP
jgi:flagellar biosynthesis/type III secretory pathway protein FliH